ncbi:hypothetical protein Hanom_Chr06g00519931 [Helianthus anomalus]
MWDLPPTLPPSTSPPPPPGVFKIGYPKISDSQFCYPNPYPKFWISDSDIQNFGYGFG